MIRILLVSFTLGLLGSHATAQGARLNDANRIGWWANFTNLRINPKWGLHLEYQWRRENYVTTWQQSLFRSGVNYQLTPKAQMRLGYAWIETFNYGDYPINALGRDFTEHRMFQMITLTDKPGVLDFSHRFMLEQRWIGRYTRPELTLEDEYVYVNRLRYLLRMQCPIQGETIDDQEWYAAAYDEILIGFGKNVNENVFDQNRVGVLLGFRFNKKWRVEGGFMHQIVQLGREITLPGASVGQNVFQYNSGFILNTYFNVDWSKG